MGRPAVGMLLLLVLVAGGCRGGGPLAATRPASTAAPAGSRIGVVDLDRVARTHPRWPELEALNKKLAEVEGQRAAPPQIPPDVQARLEAQLRAQGKKLEAQFRQEMQALQERQGARLARYVAELRAEQSGKLKRLRAQQDAELRAALETRAGLRLSGLLEILQHYIHHFGPRTHLRITFVQYAHEFPGDTAQLLLRLHPDDVGL